MVLGGGQFLAQSISSAIDKKKRWDLYKNNEMNWLHRESLFDLDTTIRTVCSQEVSFKEVREMENLVLITCNDNKDLEIIKKRSKYIDTNMEHFYVFEPRFRYHQELYNHLIDKKKDFFQLSVSDLWNSKSFLDRMKKCMFFLQLPFDENELSYGHKNWTHSNIVHEKKIKVGKL